MKGTETSLGGERLWFYGAAGKGKGLGKAAVRTGMTGPRGRERLPETMKQQRKFAPRQTL